MGYLLKNNQSMVEIQTNFNHALVEIQGKGGKRAEKSKFRKSLKNV